MSPPSDIPAAQRPVIRPRRRSFASLRAIFALMLREMSTSYGRSPGGYVWAIAEPVAAIAFLSLIFSLAFGAPPIGQSFPMFYATGMVPFLMFNDLQNKVSQSLRYSKPLLAYPNVTFLDALIARFCLNLLTQLLIAYLVLTGSMLLFEGRMAPDFGMIVQGLALAAALGLGIGTLNAFISMRVPVWQQAWGVMTRPLFILSCTLIMYDAIPQPYRDWLWWNPLVHVTGLLRGGFYNTYDTYYVWIPYPLALSMGCFVLGLVLLRRHHRSLFERM